MKRILGTVLLAWTLAGCAIGVTQDYDTSVNFQSLRTYDWQPPTQRGTNNNTLIDERLRRAIDTELQKKGYQKNASTPDFLVTYHYSIQDKLDRNGYGGPSVGVGVGGGSRGTFGGIGFGIPVGDRSYEEDTLTIDVIDSKSRKLIWRGEARQQYEPKSTPQELTERYTETVNAILAKFPPK